MYTYQGSVSVSHSMDHTSCKIAEKIISVFIGNINTKIENEVGASPLDNHWHFNAKMRNFHLFSCNFSRSPSNHVVTG
jgi:hypothetical protein